MQGTIIKESIAGPKKLSFIFTITNSLTVSASVLAPGQEPDVEVIELLPALNLTKLYLCTEAAFLSKAC